MSSVVNKSGTRFVPKVKPRSVASVTSTTKATPALISNGAGPFNNGDASMTDENKQDEDEDEDDDDDDDDDGDDEEDELEEYSNEDNDALPDNESTQVSSLSVDKPLEALHVSVQPSVTSSASMGRRRSSRLDSLSNPSNGRPLFNPNFDSESCNKGRLSGISNNASKKIRANTLHKKDANLQALKRRRTAATTVRKLGSSAQKIGIVSKIDPYDSTLRTATAILDSDQKRETSVELFQRTDSLYDKYTIRSLKEIPKNIQDIDSDRYLIDEKEFTMAELCKPKLPIGTPSENFERAKLAGRIKFAKRHSRRELRRRARQEFKSLKSLNKEDEERELADRKEAREKLLNTDIPTLTQQPQNALRLKVGQDGQMVLDEESTIVDRHRNATLENAHKERVDENPFENLYNSSTYGRSAYTDPWTSEELVKFYKSLSMWGTDFNLIAQLFPYRTRKQIKAKFVNEERRRPVIVELALRSRLPADFDQYCFDTKKQIGTISEFNEKLEGIKLKHDQEMKEIETAKAIAKEEDYKTIKNVTVNGKKSSGGFRTDELKAYRKTEVVLGTIDDIKRKKEDITEEALSNRL